MTQTNNGEALIAKKELLEDLIKRMKGVYSEYHKEIVSDELTDTLESINNLTPISQNEQQEAVAFMDEDGEIYALPEQKLLNISIDDLIKSIGKNGVRLYTSPPKQAIPDGWKIIGKVSEMGVVWYKQNPHAHPIGTEFYAVLPTTSLTSETNTEVGE